MPECYYGYHGVNHRSSKSKYCVVQTQNGNLGDLLLYLNAAVTPDTLQWVCGQLHVSHL